MFVYLYKTISHYCSYKARKKDQKQKYAKKKIYNNVDERQHDNKIKFQKIYLLFPFLRDTKILF